MKREITDTTDGRCHSGRPHGECRNKNQRYPSTKGSQNSEPPAFQGPGAAIRRVSRYRSDSLRPDRRVARPGTDSLRSWGGKVWGACPVICRLVIVETGSQQRSSPFPSRRRANRFANSTLDLSMPTVPRPVCASCLAWLLLIPSRESVISHLRRAISGGSGQSPSRQTARARQRDNQDGKDRWMQRDRCLGSSGSEDGQTSSHSLGLHRFLLYYPRVKMGHTNLLVLK